MHHWLLERLIKKITPSKKEDQSEWFKGNWEAKLCNSAVPNCGECAFRDSGLCGKLTCSYTDERGDARTVYWVSKTAGTNPVISSESVDYFTNVPILQIMADSKVVVTRAVSAEKRR